MLFVDILVTLVIAVLSGMGVGSGGLMVIYLTLIRRAPQLTAQGFNLLFFLFAAGSSMLIHLSKRAIRLPAVALMIVAGLPGAYLGTQLALWLPEGVVTRLFGIFLVLAGIPGVFGRSNGKNVQKS